MKAISPVRSVRRCYAAVCCLSSSAAAAGAAGAGAGMGMGVLHHHHHHHQHHQGLQAVDPLGVLGNMNDCYSRLKELVPSIPQDKTVSQVEILQHVIDYIFDLQIALQAEEAEEMVLSIKNADITRNFSKEDGRLCH